LEDYFFSPSESVFRSRIGIVNLPS
jgi:hypothetical protein